VASWFAVLKETVRDFSEDGGTQQAAALSYYTVFSLPPLLILLVTLLGLVLDPGDVERLVSGEAAAMLGPAADQLRTILEHADRPGNNRGLAGVLGVAALLFGATGAFMALQGALNRMWEVRPDPAQGGVKRMLVKRVFSFGMLLTIGFLMLVSLVLSTLLQAFGDVIARVLPEPFSVGFLDLLTQVVSLLVIAVLFGLIFKYLPDAQVAWRDIAVGALATTVLFMVGKVALGVYLGRSDPGSAFGAAGSLALLLVWIYYSAMIVFLGAEFTQAWATAHGREIVPERGAVRVIEQARAVRPGTAAATAAPAAAAPAAEALPVRQADAPVGRPVAAGRPLRGRRLLATLGGAVLLHWLQDRPETASRG
jgi:membrane protein